MALLADKLLKNEPLDKNEHQATKEVIAEKETISSAVDKAIKLLKPVESTIVKMKPQYIKKFGQQNYDNLLGQYLKSQIDQKKFESELSK